jgi:hypothetical protein
MTEDIIKGIIKRDRLNTDSRVKSLVDVRNYLSFVMRYHCMLSLNDIAREFNRAHPSVIHAINTHIDRTLKGDPYIEENIIEYKKELGDGNLFSIDYKNLPTFPRGRQSGVKEDQGWEVEGSGRVSQSFI